ncbi:MAG: trimethylamine methyltransferase family protein [Pseudomonadota bacterium]
MSVAKTARRGRAARKAQRAEPVESDARPVWPGVRGGRYQPLNPADIERVNETVMHLLETVGLAQAIPSMVKLVCERGGRMTDDDRLLFPRALVEDVIANCVKDFVLHGQAPGLEMEVSGTRVHVGTGGASPNIIDLESGLYREAMLRDLYDAARLVDTLDNIHFFNRSLVARDCPDPWTFDLNTAYVSMAGTRKHIGVSFSEASHVGPIAEMFDWVAGGPGKFREKPFCTLLCCHVVPPMRFAEESCEALEAGVRLGFPVQLISAGQAGATSPATLAGSVVQAVAESIAGIVFCYLIDPQAKVIFAPKALVSDLRTGAMCGGSGEQGVLMAATAQMGRYYGFVTSSMAGMTDAKTPDTQHGYEKCHGLTLAAHAGANIITQGCGLQASLLGAAFESYVIDNDMIGSMLRGVRGIEVNDETLATDVIETVVNGEGHYLGHDQTLARMEKDYYYPDNADRQSPSDWKDAGSLDARDRARNKAREVLQTHFPNHIDAATDDKIRQRFDIRLPREAMQPAA